MDFTILAVVLLLCGGIPLRNKIYKERKKKKRIKRKMCEGVYFIGKLFMCPWFDCICVLGFYQT